MQKQTNGSKQSRKGDTARTSSQGRKLASGGTRSHKKGNQDTNEDTKNSVKDEKPKRKRIPAGAITK